MRGNRAWDSGYRVCSAVRTDQRRCCLRSVRIAAGWNVLVFLFAAPAVGRFYLPAAVDHGDIPDSHLLEFRQGAGAAAADPLGIRAVSVAGAGRAARAVAGETRARWRGARDDH